MLIPEVSGTMFISIIMAQEIATTEIHGRQAFLPGKIQGLSQREIPALQVKHGKNVFRPAPEHRFLHIVWGIVSEPMFILLLIACSLYFILGSVSEGILMAAAMAMVSAISLYQEARTSRALRALKELTEPGVTVVRDGKEQLIATEELVPGDIMLLEEGMKIPADAVVLHENDLSLNESIITGESLPVEKQAAEGKNLLYQGTTVNSGKCIARVSATGNNTVLGKIGKSISGYKAPKTLLQVQINKFVRKLALFGLIGFFIIFLVNYLQYSQVVTSLLFALTLAMSAVPEEIPVAFSSFMALGAYKMSQLGIISRQPQTIENLGSVSVLCLDKTGTITENKMHVKAIYDFGNDALIDLSGDTGLHNNKLLLYAALASETNPFDSMEKAIWECYRTYSSDKMDEKMVMIYEYPLQGQPPMMTHVYQFESEKLAAAKGAVERIISVCDLQSATIVNITLQTQKFASQGYRVIGVCHALVTGPELPVDQNNFSWQFDGLLAFYDPPKENARNVLQKIHNAKIIIKLITGDHPETAINIATQVGIKNHAGCLTGDQVMGMKEQELKESLRSFNVFARMFPDAKLKVVNALKSNGEIVAMTGDGVNDGPALKASHIGIAMGHKGTSIARQASDLILTDDNLEKIVTSISEGRRISINLLKAVRYIISIHIPIVLTASLPVLLGWKYPNIFTPIHVIFLELIMGPTCSIFFEREPVEKNSMTIAPRSRSKSLLTMGETLISIIQGLAITLGVLGLYYVFMNNQHSIEKTRTIVFTTLILSNIFLTFSVRSFSKTIFLTFRNKNSLAPAVIIASGLFLVLLHHVPAIRTLFHLTTITSSEFWLCLLVALASVMWFEVYKMALPVNRHQKLLPQSTNSESET